MFVGRVGRENLFLKILANSIIHLIFFNLDLNGMISLLIDDNCCCYRHYLNLLQNKLRIISQALTCF